MSIANETNWKHTSYQMFIGDDITDYGQYVTDVTHNKSLAFEWVTPLGSNLPIARNEGDITSEGTVTFLTIGLDKLNEYARSLGFTDYIELPVVQITIINEKFDGTLVETILNDCKFTDYGISIKKGTLIIEQQIPLMIHSIVAPVDV